MNEELQLEAIYRMNRKELQTTKQYGQIPYIVGFYRTEISSFSEPST